MWHSLIFSYTGQERKGVGDGGINLVPVGPERASDTYARSCISATLNIGPFPTSISDSEDKTKHSVRRRKRPECKTRFLGKKALPLTPRLNCRPRISTAFQSKNINLRAALRFWLLFVRVSQWYVFPSDTCSPEHMSPGICLSFTKLRPVFCVSPYPGIFVREQKMGNENENGIIFPIKRNCNLANNFWQLGRIFSSRSVYSFSWSVILIERTQPLKSSPCLWPVRFSVWTVSP